MEYISLTNPLYTSFKVKYPAKRVLPSQALGIPSGLPIYSPPGLDGDKVQFGVRNRVAEAARAKREKLNKLKEKQREAIEALQEDFTDLYDQELDQSDKKAFQMEIMKLLAAHPELSMNLSLKIDLKRPKLPAQPLLHFALKNKYFGLAEYILRRDAEKKQIDYTQKDYKGKTAAQVAQLVFEASLKDGGSDDPDEDTVACEEYAQKIAAKSYQYEKLHPEKRTGTITNLDEETEEPPSRIQLKGYAPDDLQKFLLEDVGYAPREMKQFLREHDVYNVESDATDDDKKTIAPSAGQDSKSTAAPVEASVKPETPGKPKSKKQRQAENRQRLEQLEKSRRQAEIDRKEEELNTKMEAISKAAKTQKDEEERLEALKKASLKEAELNARLDALPEMTISTEWFQDRPQQDKTGESEPGWSTIEHKPKPATLRSKRNKDREKPRRNTANQTSVNRSQPAGKGSRQTSQTEKGVPVEKSSTVPITPQAPSKYQPPQPPKDSPWKLPLRSTADTKPIETGTVASNAESSQSADNAAPITVPATQSQEPIYGDDHVQAYFKSPDALFPVSHTTGEEGAGIEPFSLESDEELSSIQRQQKYHPQAKVIFPPTPQSTLSREFQPSELDPLKAPKAFSTSSRRETMQSMSSTRTFSTSSGFSNGSKGSRKPSKVQLLRKEVAEKQRLLNDASEFNRKNQAASFQVKQDLLDKALQGFTQASQLLTQTQQLQWELDNAQWERDNAQRDASYWQSEAWQRYQQQQIDDNARKAGELSSLMTAFNAKREGILQEQKQAESGSSDDAHERAEKLKIQEAAIALLEELQQQIKQREKDIQKNYIPCEQSGTEGNVAGFRVTDPVGIPGVWPGSWVPNYPQL